MNTLYTHTCLHKQWCITFTKHSMMTNLNPPIADQAFLQPAVTATMVRVGVVKVMNLQSASQVSMGNSQQNTDRTRCQ